MPEPSQYGVASAVSGAFRNAEFGWKSINSLWITPENLHKGRCYRGKGFFYVRLMGEGGHRGGKTFYRHERTKLNSGNNRHGIANINQSLGIDSVRNILVSLPRGHCTCSLDGREM